MKILLTLAILFAAQFAIADSTSYATTSGTITTAAWTQAVSGVPQASSKIMVSNTGTSFLVIGLGASGSEVATGTLIPPSTAPILIPMNIKKGARVSFKALDLSNIGRVGILFFQ